MARDVRHLSPSRSVAQEGVLFIPFLSLLKHVINKIVSILPIFLINDVHSYNHLITNLLGFPGQKKHLTVVSGFVFESLAWARTLHAIYTVYFTRSSTKKFLMDNLKNQRGQ